MFQQWFYKFSKRLVYAVFKLIWRLEVHGMENVPANGSLLFASNHISLADPPVIGCCVPRNTFFFAKEELFRIPIFGRLIRALQAFPVKRFEHDISAFKNTQRLLEKGSAVLMFPEGTRSKNGSMGKAKPGIGMLAYKAKAAVVPVFIVNSDELKQFRKIRVFFGPPIYPSEQEIHAKNYQAFADRVLQGIADLKSKMYNEISY